MFGSWRRRLLSAKTSRCACPCVDLHGSQTAFPKKAENHAHAVAIHYMYYNFVRIHQTLRITPAMEAGISDHVWSIEEMIALLRK